MASKKPSPRWERRLKHECALHTDRRRLIGGSVTAVSFLTLVLLHTGKFLESDVTAGALLYGLSLVACLVLGWLVAVRIDLPRKGEHIRSYCVFPLLPIVAMTMVECLNGVFTWDWSPAVLIVNYILYLLFYGVVFVFSGSLRLSMLVINPLFFLLGLTNHYVMAFRGTPFLPMDFMAAGTAANVAMAYDFSLNHQIIIAVLLLAFLEIVAFKLPTPRMDLVAKIASRTFFGTLIVCVVGLFAFTDMYADAGLAPDFWNQSRGYRQSGVVLNFCLNTKYLHTSAPDGYDPDEVVSIVRSSMAQEGAGDTASPNIICIMNESLADLRVLGDLRTNVDYMPFLRSLSENTVKGNLYVPVIGAGTSNTEFEFLTGASTSFFPAGSNAYTLYVNEPLPSLVSILKDQQYRSRAFHPYYPSGWNRVAVYDHFGFERFSSIYSALPYDILNEYQRSGYDNNLLEQLTEQAYPGQEVLIRRYVSDSYNYDKVIEMYQQRDRSQPFFLFNVTMQNHGGYTEQSDNFHQQVYVVNESGEIATREGDDGQPTVAYPRANQYLSLIKKSDDAFRDLIQYFEQQEEPTVICLFGDHQPNVEEELTQELLGVDSLFNLSAEQAQKQYVTPFYIWANYDIEEETIERLSVNYLSSYLLKTANVRMSDFNRYLLQLSKTVPVINNVGCIDAQGNHFSDVKDSPYAALLTDYEKVCYNLVHDSDGRKKELYTIQ